MALTKVPSNLDATIATTQSQADNSTNIATTAYVDLAVSSLSDSAPAALNTLNEIAAALGDDANYASTTTAAIAAKLPLAGGTMTGNLTVNAIVDADNFKINGGQGSDGQVLTSTGSGIAWEAIPAGGVAGIVTSANATAITIDSAETIFHKTTSPTLHSAVTGIVFENGSLLNDVTRGDGKSITLAQNLAVDSGNTWAYLAAGEGSYYQQFNGNHYFGTAASGSAGADATVNTKMFIDSSGRVGIAQDTPGDFNSGANALVIGNGSGSTGMTIRTGTGNTGNIFFADGTSGSQTYMGAIQYNHTDDALVFGTNGGTERMRITSAGGVEIGTSGSNSLRILQQFTTGSSGADVDVATSERGALHLRSDTGNAKASGITFHAGSYETQSAITSVHNSSEGTNISIHTTDSYSNGPKERFRFDHHGHARGVSFRGSAKPAQKSFVIGGGDVVKQNLQLYYNFAHSDCYATSGTSVLDLSGNSRTGYLGANVSYSSTAGGIMDFAGGNNNNGAFIGTPYALPTTDSVTMMLWIYYDDQPASPGDYQLTGLQVGGGYCYLGTSAGGGIYGYIGRATQIADSEHIIGGQQWHHLCLTRDRGNGTNGRTYIYIDGIQTAYRKSEDPYAHTDTFTIGGLNGAPDGSGSAGHTLDGKIASFALYDRALTQPEIWHNMMVDMPRLVGT